MGLEDVPVYESKELEAKLKVLIGKGPKLAPEFEDVVQKIVREAQEPCPGSGGSKVSEWLQWCKGQKDRVKLVEAKVPPGILPDNVHATLVDVKVQGKKRQPDDALYNKYVDLRNNVARGNCVLRILSGGLQSGSSDDMLVFALKKFTGGMGDEDEDQPESNHVWKDYFLGPLSSVSKVVCTIKENGEAAHMSVRLMEGPAGDDGRKSFVLCLGSKNVHLLARDKADVEKYADSRYQVAKVVAHAALDTLAAMPNSDRALLLNFLAASRLTAVFELLQPDHQHVEDLSGIDRPELRFITWTAFDVSKESYCALAPDWGLELARALGLKTVAYEVIEPDRVEARMDKVRRGYGYEGEVLYFLDPQGRVLGLLKKKTAWYVVLRAIREKGAAAFRTTPDKTDTVAKVERRIAEIQKWLGFNDDSRKLWADLGVAFILWMTQDGKSPPPEPSSVRTTFPSLWKAFLADSNKSDKIPWSSAC